MNGSLKRAIMVGLLTASTLGGVVIGATVFPTSSVFAASIGDNRTNVQAALVQNDAVIDFGHGGDARVTIKLTLDGPLLSTNTGDFTVQVIIVDKRPGGATYDSGANPPSTVR